MRTLHHFGIPTRDVRENENYLADAKLYITDVTNSPNKIETFVCCGEASRR